MSEGNIGAGNSADSGGGGAVNKKSSLSHGGWVVAAIVVSGITTVAVLYALPQILPKRMLPPLSQISVTTKGTTIVFQERGETSAVLYVPAQGASAETPWIDTKLTIKKGDIVSISASGKVHTDVYKLLVDAKADTSFGDPWATPAGVSPTGAATPSCDPILVAPGAPIGALVGAVQSESKEVPEPFFIGMSSKIRVDRTGSLLLTVNDGWLKPDSRERYAHMLRCGDSIREFTHECLVGMHTNVKLDRLWLGASKDEIEKMPARSLDDEARKLIARRHEHFTDIVETKGFDSWYRDNVGGYVVAIEVRPCEDDECKMDSVKTAVNCIGSGGAPGPK